MLLDFDQKWFTKELIAFNGIRRLTNWPIDSELLNHFGYLIFVIVNQSTT